MTTECAKQELIKRYKYLYENAEFILAPFLGIKNKGLLDDDYALIHLNVLLTDDLEEFLFSSEKMEETYFYQWLENKKKDKSYLVKVKRGLLILEKENKTKKWVPLKLDIEKILSKVGRYIDEQSGDLENKKNKLLVLDEYYKLFRYQNDGKVRFSGRWPGICDCSSVSIPLQKTKPTRDKSDIGVLSNGFIESIVKIPKHKENSSIFTEGEKQQIYLQYHDELPCDLEIACELEEEYIKTMVETRLYRPENTEPCGENFVVKEEEIFVNPNDSLYRYYQLCPHCGYIVNISKGILSKGVKERIEGRCKNDPMLFRKMFLYSELFSLDNKSSKGQRRILKK